MSACIDIIGRDITQSFVIAMVVIVLDECSNRCSQFAWHLVGHEGNLSFNCAVVSFYLAIGLRMIRRGYDMPDRYQPQVVVELPGKVPRTII